MRYDIRIPGYGGAGIFLHKTIGGNPPSQAALDVSFVAPRFVNTVRGRELGQDFLPDLACWMFSAANDAAPERTLDPFVDEVGGVTLVVVSSNDERVELAASMVQDSDAEDDDTFEMNFESSRAALVDSARRVADLCGGIDLALFEDADE